ncbi:MAG: FCD domain-containing protein [Candidatus Dormibacteraeota bacterium]|nr:FCD domain-containing protein [Candidatus Dormibacteraeota bacterium]
MGLHRQVVEDLGRRIGHGDLRPGDVVEISELEGRYGASRTAVREAIKVLTAKGLVEARPHYGTYVRPRADWNVLDADVLVWQGGSARNLALLRSLDEVRRIVEPQGARLAAERRLRADLRAMHAALRELERAEQPPELAAADLRFHRAVLAATHNELLERLAVVLQPALRLRDLVSWEHVDAAAIELHGAVLAAVEARRPKDAEARMHDLLRQAARDAERAARRRSPR